MSRHTSPPRHSVTAAVIAEMQLYGYRPHDEPDPRPLPDGQTAQAALIDIFDAVVSTFADTASSPTSRNCSGPSSTSSTAPDTARSAGSTTTRICSAAARPNRTAPKSDPSSSNA